MPRSPVFTIIMDTYYRPAMLKEAVAALFAQTYDNLEIILVNNGATEETIEYLHEAEKMDRRIKLVHFKENQFSKDDPVMMVNCWNAGLEVATGDYIWYQSDDDLISENYAEKMVALFQDNSECTTAAGLTRAMNVDGTLRRPGHRSHNYRSRYMPGHLLALDFARGGNILFRAPATIFTIKRDALVKAGGYHRTIPRSEIFGIVPFGVTGFDESAIFYFRRHEGQLHKLTNEMGWTGSDLIIEMLKEWDIEERWQVFGSAMAREVIRGATQSACEVAAERWMIQFYRGRLGSCLKTFVKMWRHKHFWTSFPREAKRRFPIRRWLRPLVKGIFRLSPGLVKVSPKLVKLRERVNR